LLVETYVKCAGGQSPLVLSL